MNHDAAHCLNYNKAKCPASCYRAQLMEDLENHKGEFVGVPLTYSAFEGTSECERSNKPVTDGMKLLGQMEDVLIKWDKPGAELRTPTMKSFLILARAVYFLLDKYVRNTHK